MISFGHRGKRSWSFVNLLKAIKFKRNKKEKIKIDQLFTTSQRSPSPIFTVNRQRTKCLRCFFLYLLAQLRAKSYVGYCYNVLPTLESVSKKTKHFLKNQNWPGLPKYPKMKKRNSALNSRLIWNVCASKSVLYTKTSKFSFYKGNPLYWDEKKVGRILDFE